MTTMTNASNFTLVSAGSSVRVINLISGSLLVTKLGVGAGVPSPIPGSSENLVFGSALVILALQY